MFTCRNGSTGLVIKATKVRTVRAAFGVGHEWIFQRDNQQIIDRSPSGGATPDLLPSTELMERVSRYVEANPGQAKNAIIKVVAGKREAVIAAIDHLVNDGWMGWEPGSHRAQRHYSVRPYREDDDPRLGQPYQELADIADYDERFPVVPNATAAQ